LDYGVIMDKKETIQNIVTKLKIIYECITKNYTVYEYSSLKEDKKDYKYKTRPYDEWDEILKGNDYY